MREVLRPLNLPTNRLGLTEFIEPSFSFPEWLGDRTVQISQGEDVPTLLVQVGSPVPMRSVGRDLTRKRDWQVRWRERGQLLPFPLPRRLEV